MAPKQHHVSVASVEDLVAVEGLVADAVRVAFDHPELTDEQRAENDWVVSIAQARCLAALGRDDKAVFVGKLNNKVVGFVLVKHPVDAMPEIDWLIVGSAHHGSGIAGALLEHALQWIGPALDIKLGVLTYNARAIAFYRKFGFEEAGPMEDDMKIPRLMMIRAGDANKDLHRFSKKAR